MKNMSFSIEPYRIFGEKAAFSVERILEIEKLIFADVNQFIINNAAEIRHAQNHWLKLMFIPPLLILQLQKTGSDLF